MVLLIDNYDSFTYNLVQYLRELKAEVIVYPHDKISVQKVCDLKPSHIVISPGPGRPENAGISIPLIQKIQGTIPLLGVCLGHQAIAAALGAQITLAPEVMHGKTSLIHHQNRGLFTDLPMPMTVMRYHSLVIDKKTLPEELKVTAWTCQADGVIKDIMAIEHRDYPLYGVQFHPESIATEAGHPLLKNFLRQPFLC